MVSPKEAVARALDPELWEQLDLPSPKRLYADVIVSEADYEAAKKASLARAATAINAYNHWLVYDAFSSPNTHKHVTARQNTS